MGSLGRAVLVVGAGLAGAAAAFAASRGGARVTVAHALPGASALAGGALDDIPWEEVERAARLFGAEPPAPPLSPEVSAFLDALGIFRVPEGEVRARLAISSGLLRPARGGDRALLDLATLPEGARIVLPRVPRSDWDADALARALSAEPFARRRGLRFDAIDAHLLLHGADARIPGIELARLHEAPERLGWLAARLAEALVRAGQRGPAPRAALLGPWLGASRSLAEALGGRLGVSVGEAMVGSGSAAGLRFEAGRDALLARLGAEVLRGRIARIDPAGGGKLLASGPALEPALEREAFDAVVLAPGGLASGGIVYAPPEHGAGADLPPCIAPPFALGLAAPVVVGPPGGDGGVVGSLHGPSLDEIAWPEGDRPGLLESVGIHARGVQAGPCLFAAGDALAGRPRTGLEAIRTGIEAGRLAAAGG